MAGAATPGIAALVKAGVPHEIVKFGHNSRERSFGAEAIRALAEWLRPRFVDGFFATAALAAEAPAFAELTGVARGLWVAAFLLICAAALALGTRLLIP